MRRSRWMFAVWLVLTTGLVVAINRLTGTTVFDEFLSEWGFGLAFAGLTILLSTLVISLEKAVRRREPADDEGYLDRFADRLANSSSLQLRQATKAIGSDPLPIEWRRLTRLSPEYQVGRAEGRIGDLADLFRASPSGRLIILGGPGSGKTTFVQLVGRRMLEERTDGPVPVIFQMAGWSGETSLSDWLVGELLRHHPVARAADPTVLHRFVMSGRVLPILDGFDEVAASRRDAVLDAIAASELPAMLTSRPDAYGTAGGSLTMLPNATVVKLLPVTLQDVGDFLRSRTPSGERSWDSVIDAVVNQPDSVIAQAFAIPINVGLAISAYTQGPSSPTELLDATRFATPTAIQTHLVETALLRVASGGPDGLSSGEPGPRAVRWLGFIAAHLERLGTKDLAWWQLGRAVPGAVFLAVAVVLGLLALLTSGMAFGGAQGLWVGGTVGVGVTGAIAVGLLRAKGLTAEPFPARIRLLNRSSLVVLAVGGSAGLTAGIVVVLRGGSVGTAVGWCMVGFALGALGALRVAVTTSADPDVVRSPRDALRRDRAMALVQGAVAAFTVTLAVILAIGFDRGGTVVVSFGLAGGLVGIAYSAYFRYSVSRIWLALRGQVPWNFMTFLDTEQRLGLLRRSGGKYRFYTRHLQDYLAAEYGPGRAGQETVDNDAVAMVSAAREELVSKAFDRTDVKAVIEAPRIETLKQEIVAEIEDKLADLVAATEAAREQFVAVKNRFVTSARVPRIARGAEVYGSVAILLAMLAGGFSVAAVAPSLISITPIMNPLIAIAFMVISVPDFATSVVASRKARLRADEDELGYAPTEAPLRRWFWTAVERIAKLDQSRAVSAGFSLLTISLFLTIMVISIWSVSLRFSIGLASVAGILALLWLWARPRKALLDALSSDDPRSWPAERQLRLAAALARRDAERAHGELIEALVEKGVLPIVAARVEVLARRSYDTTLPEASVAKLGNLTESAQFVPTETSDRLTRMLDAMSSGAIGLSGARGIGKSTVLGIFGDRRFGGNPDDLTVVVPAPTNYNSRDFLVHLFGRVCLQVLPVDTRATRATSRRRWARWVITVGLGVLLVCGAALWPTLLDAWGWARHHVRAVVFLAGAVLLAALVVETVARRGSGRRRDASIEDVARHHLRALRYLETTTRTMTGTLKPPALGEVGGSRARQRAEQVKSYPELVGDFRDFLTFLGARLPRRPDRRPPRIIICIDEVDKIATAEEAERFINDIKTIFGVPACFFLVAVSEDALASFSRRTLTMRTSFDSAFDNVIQVSRLSLPQTRRLLVQRVLRLPEPFVWLCYAMSGGLPRDLNRTVRQLYDIRANSGIAELGRLAEELIRQDLESVTHGQIMQVNDRVDAGCGPLLGWLAETTRLPLEHHALIKHAAAAPHVYADNPVVLTELWLITQRFQAYLQYIAVLLRTFRERTKQVIEALQCTVDDTKNPFRHLADARTFLSIDGAMATAAVEAYRGEMPAITAP